jgi:hypothetical protein
MCKVVNKSGIDMSSLTSMAKRFYPYAQSYMGFDKPATIVYKSDPANAKNPLGRTADYEPSTYTVSLYVDGRHPKDLLRSLAHELVHHTQNCRGDLTPGKMGETGPGYAQSNPYMRGMESEAYTQGNLCMRDWEDQQKQQSLKEHKKMNDMNIMVEALVGDVIAELDRIIEGEGDRNDKDRTQGRDSGKRQKEGSGGEEGQNLEEVETEEEEEDETVAEGEKKETTEREDEQQACAKKDKEWNTKKARCEPKKKEEGMAPDVSQHRNAGNTIDEVEEEEEEEQQEEGLEKSFEKRNDHLYERLIKNWAK